MNKENLKTAGKLGTGAILLILLSILPAIFPIIGLIALDNNITILVIICTIISIYNILGFAPRNIIGTVIMTSIGISYCVTNSVEHPIITTIFVIPLFFTIYYAITAVFDLISSIFRKRN